MQTMATVVDRLVNARDNSLGLDKAIETMVRRSCEFNGKDGTSYLEAYKAEMLM